MFDMFEMIVSVELRCVLLVYLDDECGDLLWGISLFYCFAGYFVGRGIDLVFFCSLECVE